MPSRAPLCAWFAACVVAVPFVALAQERSADEVVDAIVRDGPRAIAIRSDVDVVRRDQQARLAFPNPAVACSSPSSTTCSVCRWPQASSTRPSACC